MKKSRIIKMKRGVSFAIAAVVFLMLKTAGYGADSPSNKIGVIVSAQWQGADVISLSELNRIYLGKMTTFKGEKVTPRHRRTASPIREAFRRHVLRLSEQQLQDFWLQERIRGGAPPPKVWEPFEANVAYVATVKGAISYVDFSKLRPVDNVKVLSIRVGNRVIHPSDPDYSLTYSPPDEEMAAPIEVQSAMFKKIFPYDKTLAGSGPVKILVVYGSTSADTKDDVVRAFEDEAFSATATPEDKLAGNLEPGVVLYVMEGVGSVKRLCQERGILAITGLPSLVEAGEAALGIGLDGTKPIILVHNGQMKAVGHEFSSKLLQLAKVYE